MITAKVSCSYILGVFLVSKDLNKEAHLQLMETLVYSVFRGVFSSVYRIFFIS